MQLTGRRKPVVLSDADADALAGEIAALEPPAYTPEQVVEKFAESIRDRLDAGVAPEAIAGVLAARGFRVTRSAILAVGKERRARAQGAKAGAASAGGMDVGSNGAAGVEAAVGENPA